MTNSVIITICILLLLAYVFDLTAGKTKIPSIIVLLVLGWLVRQGSSLLSVAVPDLSALLPVLGTIGLILIVLEGSLELEFNKSRVKFIGKTALVALIPILAFSFLMAALFTFAAGVSYKSALTNVIPFAIISSAIAIPSARHLPAKEREFVTYESSLSDIFGVIFFNFIALNDQIGSDSVISFAGQLVIILAISFVATAALAFLLSRIRHPVKFVPIILMLVLIYAVSKLFHLPALLFILLFGLFLGNLDEFKSNRWIQRLKPEILNKEAHRFKELTGEIAFLVRALFFLLFGFLMKTEEVLNTDTIGWAILICALILAIRYLMLRFSGFREQSLLYIAPRGLITVLLFLSIPSAQSIPPVTKSLVIQVVILSAMVMMAGMMRKKRTQDLATAPDVPAAGNALSG